MDLDQLTKKLADACRFYAGPSAESCKSGVAMDQFEDHDPLPCFKANECLRCDLRQWRTMAEARRAARKVHQYQHRVNVTYAAVMRVVRARQLGSATPGQGVVAKCPGCHRGPLAYTVQQGTGVVWVYCRSGCVSYRVDHRLQPGAP